MAALNSAIAARMHGSGDSRKRKDKAPNYRKVLFSNDDMANFENLLSEVETVDEFVKLKARKDAEASSSIFGGASPSTPATPGSGSRADEAG